MIAIMFIGHHESVDVSIAIICYEEWQVAMNGWVYSHCQFFRVTYSREKIFEKQGKNMGAQGISQVFYPFLFVYVYQKRHFGPP